MFISPSSSPKAASPLTPDTHAQLAAFSQLLVSKLHLGASSLTRSRQLIRLCLPGRPILLAQTPLTVAPLGGALVLEDPLCLPGDTASLLSPGLLLVEREIFQNTLQIPVSLKMFLASNNRIPPQKYYELETRK